MTSHDAYLDLPLTANTQDLYLARASIRKALSSDLPKFLGAFLDIGSGLQQYLRLLNAAPSCVEQCKSLNTLRDTSGAIWQQKLGTAYRRVVELMAGGMLRLICYAQEVCWALRTADRPRMSIFDPVIRTK